MRHRLGFVRADATTLTVAYEHYAPNDPTYCPSHPPDVVRYHWNGSKVVPLDPIPPADQGLGSRAKRPSR